MSNLTVLEHQITPYDATHEYVTTKQWNKVTKVVDTVGPALELIGVIPSYSMPTTEIVDQYFDGANFVRIFHNGSGGTTSSTIAAPNVYSEHECDIDIAQPINNTPYFDVSNKGAVHVRAVGGIAPIEYDLDGGTAQSTGLFTDLNAGTYTVTAIDANGCEAEVDVTIETFSAFGDWKGITIEDYLGRDVEITLQRKSFVGTKTELCFGGTPLTLTAENIGNETNGLIIHTADLNLIETYDGEFDSLINAVSGDFALKIKVTDPSTVYETYLQYDIEDVTVIHLDTNRELAIRFKTDLLDSEETIEEYSGYISPIKLLAHFFSQKDTFKKEFNVITNLKEATDSSGDEYKTLNKYLFDASILNGLTQRDAIKVLTDTFNLTVFSGDVHTIFQSNLISALSSKTSYPYDNIGEIGTSSSEAINVRSIVNPTVGTLNYINKTQQYRFHKQIKNVEVSQSVENFQQITKFEPVWDGITLTNYTNPSSVTIRRITDRETKEVKEGIQIDGVDSYVKDCDFIKSAPFYLTEGISDIKLEIDVSAPGANPNISVDIDAMFYCQILYGDNSMTELTTFDEGMGAFMTAQLDRTGNSYKLKYENELPSSADYLTLILYQAVNTGGAGLYDITTVNVNSIKVEILPSGNYYEDDISYTEEVNDSGVTEDIDLKLSDSWNVDNAPVLFKGTLLKDDLTKTTSWNGTGITGNKALNKALAEIKAGYKDSKIKRLSCTLIDDPPKWNTVYQDATIPGAYFRLLPSWSYDFKRNQLQCEMIEMLFGSVSLGDRLLETGDTRLLETADIRQLE